jgi:hypothetical protein
VRSGKLDYFADFEMAREQKERETLAISKSRV